MAVDTLFPTPFGVFNLQRYPGRQSEPLQAWCGADLLLLEECHRLSAVSQKTLVVNDEHGALSVALEAQCLWTDSACAAEALRRNLAINERADVAVIWSTREPSLQASLMVLRVPKQLPFLEYQLATLSRLMPPDTVLLAAGMDKHLSPHVAELLELHIGPTERHRGQRKARLFSARRDERSATAAGTRSAYYCEPLAAELQSGPNVFSRDKLDGGSRLLLDQLPRLGGAATILDLVCGNGVLGLGAYKAQPASRVVFADESAMALASAEANARRLFGQASHSFSFHHGDGLSNYLGPVADLILCNPPFHLNHAVDDYAGRRLLGQCAGHLQAGGRLCLVANRHLDYTPTLKRFFQRVTVLARDRRFNVYLAERR